MLPWVPATGVEPWEQEQGPRMSGSAPYLTVGETAAELRCHPETVRRMLRRGELEALRARNG
jgi:excisionase family DNA binding protein